MREEKGLSATALGARVGVTRAAVSAWEVKGLEPRPELLEDIARVLDVQPAFLRKGRRIADPLAAPEVQAVLDEASEEVARLLGVAKDLVVVEVRDRRPPVAPRPVVKKAAEAPAPAYQTGFEAPELDLVHAQVRAAIQTRGRRATIKIEASPEELLEGVERALGARRGEAVATLDPHLRMLRIGPQEVPLTPSEFVVMRELISAGAEGAEHDALLDAVYGKGSEGRPEGRIIGVYMSKIRRKLQIATGRRDLIRRSRGDRWAIANSLNPIFSKAPPVRWAALEEEG